MQVDEPGADHVPGGGEAVHPGHRVVALGQDAGLVDPVHELLFGQPDRDGGDELEAGHALRALLDERAVALFALAQRLAGTLALGDVHPQGQPAALRQRYVGPRRVDDAAVPRPGAEVGPVARRVADGLPDALLVRGVGVHRREDVPLAGVVRRVAEHAGPLAIAPRHMPALRVEEGEHHRDVLDDLPQQVGLRAQRVIGALALDGHGDL